jgi:PAS domain S-box-containing protein
MESLGGHGRAMASKSVSLEKPRKQSQARLVESRELAQALMRSAGTGTYIVQQGQFEYVNSLFQEITGYTEAELATVNSLDLVHPEDREVVRRKAIESLKGQSSCPYEYRFVRRNGEVGWVLEKVTSATYKGKPAAVGSFMDITERKRAEEEREALLKDIETVNRKLQQSNKELEDFAYIASHDLREPLRKISSFGALLQDSLEGKLDEDEEENLEFMIDGAKRLQAMIDDLLTYSRLTTRAKPHGRVDLNEVIEHLENLELATLLDEAKGTIRVPQPLLPVQGDLSQIYQLFQNLIGNGLKFHQKGIPPEVTIRACQVQDNMVRVEVEDSGIGIGEEYHEQIFTMFKRLHSREKYGGTGIGLAVCKKIVDRHGGNIGVKSTPGGGSTFWFTLPRGSYL